MDLQTVLKAIQAIGPAAATVAEVRKVVGEAIAVLHPTDQATAKAALADVQADNDEGHRRLQEKLNAAARG